MLRSSIAIRKHVIRALGLGAALWVASGAGAQTAPDPKEAAPQIEVRPGTTIDLGKIRGYGITNVTCFVRNRGLAPLLVERITSTCPCLQGKLDKMEIAPGAEAVLTMSLDASQVHDAFKRGIWIHSNAAQTPRVAVSLVGEVVSFFTGVTSQLTVLSAQAPGETLTNKVTLTAIETGLTLGLPRAETVGNITVALQIVTNLVEPVSYELTAVFTPLSAERHNVTIILPVIGNQHATPVELLYRVMAGAELVALPNKLLVRQQSRAQNFRLMIRTKGPETDPQKLTWEPAVAGLTLVVSKTPRGRDLVINGTITPAAAQQLRAAETTLRFSYPGYKPVSVTCVAAPESGAAVQ